MNLKENGLARMGLVRLRIGTNDMLFLWQWPLRLHKVWGIF